MIFDNRVRQYEAWPGETPPDPFPSGDFLCTKRSPGYDRSANQDCWLLWDAINAEAQGISTLPGALSPVITRDLLGRVLDGINRVFAVTNSHVVSRANLMFTDTFGGPALYSYEPYAIRWPGESRLALTCVLDFVSSAFQLIHVKSNLVDNGILEEHAIVTLKPLFGLKMRLMREYFGMEPKGSISPNELTAVFRGSNVHPPLTSSFDDLRDLNADQVTEDAMALTNESAPVPDEPTMTQITSGVEVWTWVPTLANWATCGEILRRREVSNPTMTPAEPFPFASDVIRGGSDCCGESPPGGTPGLTTPA